MLYISCGNIVQLTLWSLWLFLSESPLFWAQCHSESSRSEDISSDGEEDESPSLSPSSSHSCSKVGHSAPPSDSPAPCSLQIEGANFLSATPAHWSVEEVCRFISSLQGWCSLISFVSLNHVSSFRTNLPSCVLFRLWRVGCPVLVTGNRRAGSAASARGPPHFHHEYQAGSRS